MSKITQEEVAGWIRQLVPYLENPMVLSPKGCLKKGVEAHPGLIIEYETALQPQAPQVISQSENMKLLIELYKSVSSGQDKLKIMD